MTGNRRTGLAAPRKGVTVKRTHVVARRIAAGLAALAAGMGLIGLAGWTFDVSALRTVFGGTSTLKPNTALCLIAAGAALFALAALPRQSRSGMLLRQGAAALAGIVGLATVAEYRLGIDLGIDQLLFADPFTPGGPFPGRMSHASAAAFVVFAVSILLTPRAPAWSFWAGFALTALGFWVAIFVTVGYALQAEAIYTSAWFARGALPNAVGLLSLFAGLTFAVPERGWARIVMTDKFGGYVARRLLPLMAALPIFILWLSRKGAALGLYAEPLAEYVSTVALLIVLTTVVLVTCGRLNVLDKHRCSIEEERRRAHAAALRLRQIAETDALTGLSNRRHFLAVAEERVAQARGLGAPLSALMVDIDHFKRINDAHGHAAGDQALSLLAATLRESTREADCVARIGGEEFAILLPGAIAAVAQDIAERICRHVAALAILDGEGKQFGFTVSIGVAGFDPSDTKPEALLARADAALYLAKRAGRNRVETASARDAA